MCGEFQYCTLYTYILFLSLGGLCGSSLEMRVCVVAFYMRTYKRLKILSMFQYV